MNYNQDFESAKNWYKFVKEENNQLAIDILEEFFLQLRESEDDEVKKAIIELVRQSSEILSKQNQNNMLAWLEKQGEKNNNEDADILQRFSFYSYKDEPNVLYLSNVFVNEEYRNKGIGTKILKIADEVSTYLKCNSIRLKTENGSNAESLYRKNGYKILTEEGKQIWLEKQAEKKDDNKYPSKKKSLNVDDLSNIQSITKILNNAKKYYCNDNEIVRGIEWVNSLKNI